MWTSTSSNPSLSDSAQTDLLADAKCPDAKQIVDASDESTISRLTANVTSAPQSLFSDNQASLRQTPQAVTIAGFDQLQAGVDCIEIESIKSNVPQTSGAGERELLSAAKTMALEAFATGRAHSELELNPEFLAVKSQLETLGIHLDADLHFHLEESGCGRFDRRDSGLPYTLIRNSSGEVFALRKKVLGKGATAVVREAQLVESISSIEQDDKQKWVAVKKVRCPSNGRVSQHWNDALHEIDNIKILKNNRGVIKTFEPAVTNDKHGHKKAYMFMEKASGNGLVGIAECHSSGGEGIREIAKEWLSAAVRLKEEGYEHLDIKPDNILMTDQGYRYGDLAAVFAQNESLPRQTIGSFYYWPPELFTSRDSVTNSNRVSFALGMCLLVLKNNSYSVGNNKRQQFITVQENSGGLSVLKQVLLRFKIGEVADSGKKSVYCEGYQADPKQLKGHTLDEVIAKLIAVNPEDRITPAEALRLPYFL